MKIKLFFLFSAISFSGAVLAQQAGALGVGGVAGTITPVVANGGAVTARPTVQSASCGDGAGGGTKPRMCADVMSISVYSRAMLESVITTTVSQMTVESAFNTSLGVVNVVIRDANGMLYYLNNVNTSVSRNLSINIGMFPSGDYTILYTDTYGTLIEQVVFRVK